MRKLGVLVVGFNLIFVTLAFSCDYYQDCMNDCPDNGFYYDRSSSCVKAVAYKLDEISKKLDKK